MVKGDIARLDLNRVTIKPLIREVAETSKKVLFTRHVEERMIQKSITRAQIMRCLKHGHITEGPAQDMKGGWKFRVEVIAAGDSIKVVASLFINENNNNIVVITAYI